MEIVGVSGPVVYYNLLSVLLKCSVPFFVLVGSVQGVRDTSRSIRHC